MMTVTELFARRDQVRRDLEAGDRHVLSVLRDPEPEMQSAPIGDVLCWCDGLGEAAVTRILALADVKWGQRVSQLSQREVTVLCFEIKRRHPATWDRWRESLHQRKTAA